MSANLSTEQFRSEQWWNGIVMRLFTPIDIASVAVFRIAFGFLMFVEVVRYFAYDWIREYYISPQFHFSYYGLDWIKPLPGDAMYIYFVVLGILALCIGFGLFYRFTAPLFFLVFTYLFFMEEARWLNHFYLIILLSFWLMLIPAHRAFSIDAWLRPGIRSATIPTWTLWVLRAQIALVYLFGSVAKLSPDWLHGQPMGMWLAAHTDFPLIGALFTQKWMALAFSYGGFLFDLTFVPFILWRRTRPFAFVVGLLFHVTNSQLFIIGIFPWMMIAANMLFFPPDWPRYLRRRFRPDPSSVQSVALQPKPYQVLIAAGLGAYFGIQLFVPLRHYLFPGDINWSQQADRFSWRMKLLEIQGEAHFLVTEPGTSNNWDVDPSYYLADWQIHEMVERPDMVLQFSHYLADTFQQLGYSHVEVRAQVLVSLNGRPSQPIVDPEIDLAAQPRILGPVSWILPLTEPLPDQP